MQRVVLLVCLVVGLRVVSGCTNPVEPPTGMLCRDWNPGVMCCNMDTGMCEYFQDGTL